MSPSGAAFFDVDETLVSVRTLESFLLFYLKRVPSMIAPERLRELAGEVVALPRSEFNRRYYAIWGGQPVEQVLDAGRDWFAEAQREPGFYRPNVLAALREHRANGDRVVLVSGSFPPPLAPLAEALGADALYCTDLEVGADGAYTGVIGAAMIGDDKRTVVEAYLDELPAGARAASWGYGDHSSDLPLLEGVAHPVVVGSDPAMLELAAERDWPVLPIEQPLAPRA